MMEITIQVPDALGRQLQQYQGRLSELLERGLRDLAAEGNIRFQDENGVLEVLASQPSPEQVLALQASPELQERVADLLERSARKELSAQEEAELDRHLVLEHLVRLAKAHAYKALSSRA
jgi:predicted Rossmann fold nucleotide-binding protein DprA/Smf involved in DNA uptake